MAKDYTYVLLKDIQNQIQRLAEAMRDVPSQLKNIKKNLHEVEIDVKAIKSAVTDQSRQVTDHETRLIILENRPKI